MLRKQAAPKLDLYLRPSQFAQAVPDRPEVAAKTGRALMASGGRALQVSIDLARRRGRG